MSPSSFDRSGVRRFPDGGIDHGHYRRAARQERLLAISGLAAAIGRALRGGATIIVAVKRADRAQGRPA